VTFRAPRLPRTARRLASRRAIADLLARGLVLAAVAVVVAANARAEPVAITFDDLPHNGELAPGTRESDLVRRTLKILEARRLPPAYGFVNAAKLEGNPDGAEALRLWIAGGQRVGNHAYSHLDLHRSDPASFLEDVRRNEPVLEVLDASDRWRWFRYPYLREGDTVEKRRAVRASLAERGYRTAQVTLDYEDYLWNSAYARCAARRDATAIAELRRSYLEIAAAYLDANREMARRVYGREIPHVLLLHLGEFTPEILPALLDMLHAKGFTPATLEDVQRDPAYDADPDSGSKYGGTLLEQLIDARGLKYPPLPRKPYAALEAACR
jgi:peptidoglycan/xylan/chitin deacetylase (PgdA/CDA1 family)